MLPFLAQARAHSNSAVAETFGLLFCLSIALQQGMFAMPLMLHWFSPKPSGTPANAPPKSTSKRNNDASRFFTFTPLYLKLLIPVNFSTAPVRTNIRT